MAFSCLSRTSSRRCCGADGHQRPQPESICRTRLLLSVTCRSHRSKDNTCVYFHTLCRPMASMETVEGGFFHPNSWPDVPLLFRLSDDGQVSP